MKKKASIRIAISGASGSGKTTIAELVHDALVETGFHVVLTGTSTFSDMLDSIAFGGHAVQTKRVTSLLRSGTCIEIEEVNVKPGKVVTPKLRLKCQKVSPNVVNLKCQKGKTCVKQPGKTIIPKKVKWCTGCSGGHRDVK